MKKGERVTNKTKTSIKNALLALMHTKNYPEIRVNEITLEADVGRSTFYKHYPSKAAVLVDIHKDMFERLFSVLHFSKTRQSLEPPEDWVSFLEKYQRLGRNPFQLTYKLGNDLDFLMTQISGKLTEIIEYRLQELLSDMKCTIPLSIIAQAVSATFSSLIISWFTRFQAIDAQKYATNIHRMIMALIWEAIDRQEID